MPTSRRSPARTRRSTRLPFRDARSTVRHRESRRDDGDNRADQVGYTPSALDRDAIFYFGYHGWQRHEHRRPSSSELSRTDLLELALKHREAVFDYVAARSTKYVVLAAARVSGILASMTYPVDFLSDNMCIRVNVLDAALRHEHERVLFGSWIIEARPPADRRRPAPHRTLEPTSHAYAIAKIAGILQVQAVRRAVQPAVDLGDADQSLRSERQLHTDRVCTSCPR